MTKMSRAQRELVLIAHSGPVGICHRGELPLFVRHDTVEAMVRNGHALRQPTGFVVVTPAGLRAAGVDIDALHAEALGA